MGNLRRAAVVVAVAGAVVAVALAVVGFVLAARYRPLPGLATADLWGRARTTERWLGWHGNLATALAVVAAVATLLAYRLRDEVGLGRLPGPLVGAGVVALVMTTVVVATRPIVEWDQLGLWSVTVGDDLDGYWHAAFDDDVRFVLTDGRELTQTRYSLAVVAHLAAPVVAAAALAAMALQARRRAPG